MRRAFELAWIAGQRIDQVSKFVPFCMQIARTLRIDRHVCADAFDDFDP
jgi:hypothetical protein